MILWINRCVHDLVNVSNLVGSDTGRGHHMHCANVQQHWSCWSQPNLTLPIKCIKSEHFWMESSLTYIFYSHEGRWQLAAVELINSVTFLRLQKKAWFGREPYVCLKNSPIETSSHISSPDLNIFYASLLFDNADDVLCPSYFRSIIFSMTKAIEIPQSLSMVNTWEKEPLKPEPFRCDDSLIFDFFGPLIWWSIGAHPFPLSSLIHTNQPTHA